MSLLHKSDEVEVIHLVTVVYTSNYDSIESVTNYRRIFQCSWDKIHFGMILLDV